MKEYQKKNLKVLLIKTIVFVCICACLLLLLLFSKPFEAKVNNLYFNFSQEVVSSKTKVHFIDVGQGDCTLIQLPDNKNILIDTGPSNSLDKVIKYLSVLGINKNDNIDYLILTHTDADHIGNAKDIAEYFNVSQAYIPKLYSTYEILHGLNVNDYNVDYSQLWSNTVKSLHKNVSTITYVQKDLKIEDATANYSLIFLSPFSEKISNKNNYSPLILLNIDNIKMMFVGDAEASVENEFLSYYEELISTNYFDVSVLKVAHHGSKGSTQEEFLAVLKPEYAVISSGKDNSYNHPNNQTINNLNNINCNILRTDLTSSVVIGVNNGQVVTQTNYDKILFTVYKSWHFVVSGIVISFVCIYVIKYKDTKEK